MPNAIRYLICAPPQSALITRAHRAQSIRHVDPWLVRNASFIERVNQLARRWAPDESLTIPEWALYDCAESSGFIAGFEEPVDESPNSIPAPRTMLAASPGLRRDEWHCLALRGPTEHLRQSLEFAFDLTGASGITAVFGWADPLLPELTRGWSPEVLTAWTPAHARPASATLRLTDRAPRPAEARTETVRLNPHDPAAMQLIQSQIEFGRRAWLGNSTDGISISLEAEDL